MKRILLILAITAMLAGASWGGVTWASRPDPVYWLSVDQHFKYGGPQSFAITAYKLDDYWLWYRETDGSEYTINVHGRNIIITSRLNTDTQTEDERRANVNGDGAAGR